MKKRIITTLLVASLATFTFVGCKKASNKTTIKPTTADNSNTNTNSNTTTKEKITTKKTTTEKKKEIVAKRYLTSKNSGIYAMETRTCDGKLDNVSLMLDSFDGKPAFIKPIYENGILKKVRLSVVINNTTIYVHTFDLSDKGIELTSGFELKFEIDEDDKKVFLRSEDNVLCIYNKYEYVRIDDNGSVSSRSLSADRTSIDMKNSTLSYNNGVYTLFTREYSKTPFKMEISLDPENAFARNVLFNNYLKEYVPMLEYKYNNFLDDTPTLEISYALPYMVNDPLVVMTKEPLSLYYKTTAIISNGNITECNTVNVLNKLETKTTFSYDSKGNTESVITPIDKFEYSYDEYHRVSSYKHSELESDSFVLKEQYDYYYLDESDYVTMIDFIYNSTKGRNLYAYNPDGFMSSYTHQFVSGGEYHTNNITYYFYTGDLLTEEVYTTSSESSRVRYAIDYDDLTRVIKRDTYRMVKDEYNNIYVEYLASSRTYQYMIINDWQGLNDTTTEYDTENNILKETKYITSYLLKTVDGLTYIVPSEKRTEVHDYVNDKKSIEDIQSKYKDSILDMITTTNSNKSGVISESLYKYYYNSGDNKIQRVEKRNQQPDVEILESFTYDAIDRISSHYDYKNKIEYYYMYSDDYVKVHKYTLNDDGERTRFLGADYYRYDNLLYPYKTEVNEYDENKLSLVKTYEYYTNVYVNDIKFEYEESYAYGRLKYIMGKEYYNNDGHSLKSLYTTLYEYSEEANADLATERGEITYYENGNMQSSCTVKYQADGLHIASGTLTQYDENGTRTEYIWNSYYENWVITD